MRRRIFKNMPLEKEMAILKKCNVVLFISFIVFIITTAIAIFLKYFDTNDYYFVWYIQGSLKTVMLISAFHLLILGAFWGVQQDAKNPDIHDDDFS